MSPTARLAPALALLPLLLGACATDGVPADYLAVTGRADELSGGARRIPVETERGTFSVWTKRFGNNPRIKLLLLHGGPGLTHEYLEAMDTWLPGAGLEYYYYDQLDSGFSDRPGDPALWEVDRFVDEVEQVRAALGLDHDDFYLYGHSWGGVLALEYALKYPQHLKGLIVSDMMASGPLYNRYAEDVLMPAMDPDALARIECFEAEGRTDDPEYMELLMQEHYTKHVLRLPMEQWPEPVVRSLGHVNHELYVAMQGPSELGLGGKLLTWDRTADLGRIATPTLVIGGRHDTMDPAHLEWMAGQVQRGRFHLCEAGSHLCLYDDAASYFEALIGFARDVDAGRF